MSTSTNGKKKRADIEGARKYYSPAARKALKRHGGARPGSGRPAKPDPENWVQVTCVLRKDTVQKLREGAGGKQKFFGGFLQFHLDRFPLPTHEEYEAMRQGKPYFRLIKRRKVPVVFAGNIKAARLAKPVKPRHDATTAKFLAELAQLRR